MAYYNCLLIDADGTLLDFEASQRKALAAALGQFGSGWAWLSADRDGRLSVQKTANQDTPLPLIPLLCCDVWEHAYYIDYRNSRPNYLNALFDHLIDWEFVARNYYNAK